MAFSSVSLCVLSQWKDSIIAQANLLSHKLIVRTKTETRPRRPVIFLARIKMTTFAFREESRFHRRRHCRHHMLLARITQHCARVRLQYRHSTVTDTNWSRQTQARDLAGVSCPTTPGSLPDVAHPAPGKYRAVFSAGQWQDICDLSTILLISRSPQNTRMSRPPVAYLVSSSGK